MAELPRLTGPAVPPEEAAGVQVGVPSNSGAFAAARAVGEVGDQVARVNMRMLKRQNRIDTMKAQSDYGQKMSEFQLGLDPNRPQDWPGQVQEHSKGLLEGIRDSDLAPAAKDALELRLGSYEARVMSDIRAKAEVAQLEILGGEFQNRQRAYIQNEDFDGAREDFRQFAKDARLPQHEIEAGIMDLDDKEREMRDEYEALMGNEDYEFSGSKSDQIRKRDKARAMKAGLEAQDAKAVNDAIKLGEITNESQLERALNAATDMSEATKKLYRKNWKKTEPVGFNERQEYLDWMNEAAERYENGKLTLDQYRREHFQIQTAVEALGGRDQTNDMAKRLDEIHPEAIEKERATAFNKTMATLDREVERWAADWHKKGGFFDGDPEDMTAVDSNIADVKRQRAQTAMKTWLRTDEGQKATPEERAAKWREIAGTIDIEEAIDASPSADVDLYNDITVLPKLEDE